jgi:hypothetical protein
MLLLLSYRDKNFLSRIVEGTIRLKLLRLRAEVLQHAGTPSGPIYNDAVKELRLLLIFDRKIRRNDKSFSVNSAGSSGAAER